MRKLILVIDDEEAVRKSFLLGLEDSGYEVWTAASGEGGLQRIRERKPDLIYLDLKMPGLGGVETLREIRKSHKDIPVYIVTAFIREFLDQLSLAAKEGIRFELINKPIGSDQILKISRAVLEAPSKI